jgi:O-antigen/teichoic acid export membrane protein
VAALEPRDEGCLLAWHARPEMQKKDLVNNTLLSFFTEVIPILVGIFAVPPIIHGLGTARFGILSLAWIFMWYFGVFDFGLSRAATKYVSEAIGCDEKNKIPQLVWTAILGQLAIGVIGVVILISLTPAIVTYLLKIPYPLMQETTSTFYVIAFMIPAVMVTITLKGVLEAAQRFDMIAIVKIPANLSTYILSLAGVHYGLSLPGIIAVLLLSRCLILLAYLVLVIHIFPDIIKTVSFRLSVLRSFLSYGGWVTISNVAGTIFGYLERLLITYYLSVTALSYYAAPADMITRLVIIPMSMATVLFPAFSSVGMTDRTKTAAMISRPIKYLLLTMTPITVTLVAFAHPVLQAWLGNDFARNSALPLQILAVSLFLNAFALIPYAMIQGLGKPECKAKLDLVELPVYVALNVLLIPPFGIVGAAVAKLVITVIDSLSLFVMARYVAKLLFTEVFPPKLCRGFAISILYVAGAISLQIFPKPFLVDILGMGALSVGYVGVFFMSAMDELDRSAMYVLLRPHLKRSLTVRDIRD